jgi:hypothetical protein
VSPLDFSSPDDGSESTSETGAAGSIELGEEGGVEWVTGRSDRMGFPERVSVE